MTTRKTMLQKQGMKNSKRMHPFFMPLSRYPHVLWKHSSILLLENQEGK